MRMRWVITLGLLSLSLYGQGNFASIEGRIVNRSQPLVAGARAEIRAKATGAVRTTLTNEVGWYADAFAQDSWRLTPHTTLDIGLRYEYMSARWSTSPETGAVSSNRTENCLHRRPERDAAAVLKDPNKLRFAPRLGVAHHFDKAGLVLRAAY